MQPEFALSGRQRERGGGDGEAGGSARAPLRPGMVSGGGEGWRERCGTPSGQAAPGCR